MEISKSNGIFLPKELHNVVFSFLDIKSQVACREVCRSWKRLVDNNEFKKSKITYLFDKTGLSRLPENIAAAFDCYGPKQMIELPVLNVGDRKNDCLNFFKIDEMTSPVMRGLDSYKRPFISIKVKITNDEKNIITLFKRYTNDNMWVACFSYPEPSNQVFVESYFGFTWGSIDKEKFRDSIKELLKGTSIEVSPGVSVSLDKEDVENTNNP